MTTLIFRNNTTQSINSMSGETGELFVDTTKNTVVVALDGQNGGIAIGSEEYALNNLLPSKQNKNGKYLYLNGNSAEWHKLNIVRPGTSVKSIIDLQEPDFIKFDGSHKNKTDYPDLSSILEPDYGLFDNLVSSKSNFLNGNSQPVSYYQIFDGPFLLDPEVRPPMPTSNYNNMVFDGTHYVRILGVIDNNYSTSGNSIGGEGSEAITFSGINPNELFYPIYQPPYPPLGNQFKVQYSTDAINWNTVTVAPFSNNATRCASLCTDGIGGIYMVAQNIGNREQLNLGSGGMTNDVIVKSTNHGVTWNQLLPISYNDGRIITCNPITKHLYLLPGLIINQTGAYQQNNDYQQTPRVIKKSENNGVLWSDVTVYGDALNNSNEFNNPLYTQNGLMVCVSISYLPAFIQDATGDHWNKVKYHLLYEVQTDPNNNPQLTRLEYREYTHPNAEGYPLLASQKTAPRSIPDQSGSTFLNNRKYQFEPYITYNPADGYFYSAQTFSSSGIYDLVIEDPGFGYPSNIQSFELSFTAAGQGGGAGSDFYVNATGYVTISDFEISSAVITNPGYGYKTPPTAWLTLTPSSQFDPNNPGVTIYARQAKINLLYDQNKERGTIVIKRHIANTLNGLSYQVPKAFPNNNIEELFEVPATLWEDYAVFDNKELFNPIEDELGLDSSDYRFGLGLHRLHISPIFGFMILTKNKILYNIDPVNNPDGWTKVTGLDESKLYNFSTCINVNDGVIISAENEVIKLYKSTTKFALNIIQPETVSGITINTYLKA
jgi:hypothetical protein